MQRRNFRFTWAALLVARSYLRDAKRKIVWITLVPNETKGVYESRLRAAVRALIYGPKTCHEDKPFQWRVQMTLSVKCVTSS